MTARYAASPLQLHARTMNPPPSRLVGTALAAALALYATLATAAPQRTLDGDPAIVIAHRGASGYLPEHTLAGYELAVRMGADYIEPDLQLTRDGRLVAIHDDTLTRTTNVQAVFGPRNGGYRVSDFTLAELQTLQMKLVGTAQATYPGFTPSSPEALRIPTFEDVIALAQRLGRETGRSIGIYPEAKQSDPLMEDKILAALQASGYGTDGKVFVQSFSDATVRSLYAKQDALGLDLPLVLLGGAFMLDGTAHVAVFGATGTSLLSLADVAGFADGIGVVINYAQAPITPEFIAQAHAAGLAVHGWTFGQPDPVLAAAEYRRYLDMGMDGVFSNYPDLAVAAVAAQQVPEPPAIALVALGMAGLALVLRRRRS